MQKASLGQFGIPDAYCPFVSEHPVTIWRPFPGQAHLVVSRMQTGRTLETQRQSAPSRDWQVRQRSRLYPARSAKSSKAKIVWTSQNTWKTTLHDGLFQPEPSTSVLLSKCNQMQYLDKTWRECGAAILRLVAMQSLEKGKKISGIKELQSKQTQKHEGKNTRILRHCK